MKYKTERTFRCDFCNKLYLRKKPCANHENGCTSNPINFRACIGCANLSKKEVLLYGENEHGQTSIKVNILFCSKINSFLYPPKVERKGNSFLSEDLHDGETPNQPMKKVGECEFGPTHYHQALNF